MRDEVNQHDDEHGNIDYIQPNGDRVHDMRAAWCGLVVSLSPTNFIRRQSRTRDVRAIAVISGINSAGADSRSQISKKNRENCKERAASLGGLKPAPFVF